MAAVGNDSVSSHGPMDLTRRRPTQARSFKLAFWQIRWIIGKKLGGAPFVPQARGWFRYTYPATRLPLFNYSPYLKLSPGTYDDSIQVPTQLPLLFLENAHNRFCRT